MHMKTFLFMTMHVGTKKRATIPRFCCPLPVPININEWKEMKIFENNSSNHSIWTIYILESHPWNLKSIVKPYVSHFHVISMIVTELIFWKKSQVHERPLCQQIFDHKKWQQTNFFSQCFSLIPIGNPWQLFLNIRIMSTLVPHLSHPRYRLLIYFPNSCTPIDGWPNIFCHQIVR